MKHQELYSEPGTYSASARGYVTHLNSDEYAPDQTASCSSLRFSTRLKRNLGLAAAVSLLGGGAFLANEESSAHAETVSSASVPHHVYRTGGDGVWLHQSAGLHAPLEVVMPEGAEFDISCWQTGDVFDGDGIWLDGSFNGREGSVTDYYIDDHWHTTADFAAQGIPECGANEQHSYDESGYDRSVAASYALEHARDVQKYGPEECTWFVSNALWAGGLQQTDEWNGTTQYFNRHIPGTDIGSGAPGSFTAWDAPSLIDYIEKTYPESTWQELNLGQNSQPEAKPGDVIAYDWQGDGHIDHLALVVDDAPGTQYPEVSEQGNVLSAGQASPSQKQGWTYSRVYNGWIQTAKRADGQRAYPNPHAYLLHIVVNGY